MVCLGEFEDRKKITYCFILTVYKKQKARKALFRTLRALFLIVFMALDFSSYPYSKEIPCKEKYEPLV